MSPRPRPSGCAVLVHSQCLMRTQPMSAETCKRLCFMNTAPDEIIRSLFYNKNNDSLITVSVYSMDNYTSLRCRTTPLECALGPEPSRPIISPNPPSRCRCTPCTAPHLAAQHFDPCS